MNSEFRTTIELHHFKKILSIFFNQSVKLMDTCKSINLATDFLKLHCFIHVDKFLQKYDTCFAPPSWRAAPPP